MYNNFLSCLQFELESINWRAIREKVSIRQTENLEMDGWLPGVKVRVRQSWQRRERVSELMRFKPKGKLELLKSF